MRTQPKKTVLRASRQGEIADVFCISVGEYLEELFSFMEEAENARENVPQQSTQVDGYVGFWINAKLSDLFSLKMWYKSGI